MSQDRKRKWFTRSDTAQDRYLSNWISQFIFPAERLEFPDFSLKKTLSLRLRFDPKKHFFNDRWTKLFFWQYVMILASKSCSSIPLNSNLLTSLRKFKMWIGPLPTFYDIRYPFGQRFLFWSKTSSKSSKNNITLLRFYPRTKTVSSKEFEKGAKKITVVRCASEIFF